MFIPMTKTDMGAAVTMKCDRCQGTGTLGVYNGKPIGRCHRCKGSGKRVTTIKAEQARVTKHTPYGHEHNQMDHAGTRSGLMRGFLHDVIGPFFFSDGSGKHRKPPDVDWYDVFDAQMDEPFRPHHKTPYKDFREPVEINDKGAYFIPMSRDPNAGDGYFFTSTGKRLWGRFGAAGVMMRSHDALGTPIFLLAKRSANITGGGGTWAVPGGAIDKNETHEEGALRELSEEIGDLPAHLNYANVGADVNEVEDGWKYTTVLADVDEPYETSKAKDWETEEGGIGWFSENQIRHMNLHPAMADRLDLIFDLWKQVDTQQKRRGGDKITQMFEHLAASKNPGSGPTSAERDELLTDLKHQMGIKSWIPHTMSVSEKNQYVKYSDAEGKVVFYGPDGLGGWKILDDVAKHMPGLHNQKSHGHRGVGFAPWTQDGGGFLSENEWNFHKWAYAYNIDGYKNQYDTWHQETFKEAYLPWDAPDDKVKQPAGAPDADTIEDVSVSPAPDLDTWVDQTMADSKKPVAAAPDTPHGDMVEGLTVKDNRKDKATAPLDIDFKKFPLIYELDGVPNTAQVELRLETAKPGDPYGSCQHVGGDKFIVRVFVLALDKVASDHPKGEYPNDALYVINNSLVHEMRHVAQHYQYPNMDSDYGKEMSKNGYDGNFYEKEAWLWGHYADPTGTKGDTTEYGDKTITLTPVTEEKKFAGYDVWAIHHAGWEAPSD